MKYSMRMTISPGVRSFVGTLMVTAAMAAILSGCGSIRTEPLPSADVKLSCNPPKIYVAPFDIENAKILIGRQGRWDSGYDEDYIQLKRELQRNFQQFLVERLQKVAPTEARWVEDLPDEGWLVGGKFDTIYQGSRFLRSVVGFGVGDTTFQTTVYVYDLSKSKTHYLLAFRTGVPDSLGEGKGSGRGPGLVVNAPYQMGSGLRLDMTRTAREIRNVLMKYASPAPLPPPAPEPRRVVARERRVEAPPPSAPEPVVQKRVEPKPALKARVEQPDAAVLPIDRPTYNSSEVTPTYRSRGIER